MSGSRKVMTLRGRHPSTILLLSLSLLAASSASDLPHPTFLLKLGEYGTSENQFDDPNGVDFDSAGNMYVAEGSNQRVQKIDSSHTFVTAWGSYGKGDDGFWGPAGVAIGPLGTICVADLYNRRVKEFDEEGEFLQTWGWGVQDGASRFQVCTENCQQGVTGTGDGQFAIPQYLEFDGNGNLHVPEHSNGHHVQKFGFSWMNFYIADLRTPQPPMR